MVGSLHYLSFSLRSTIMVTLDSEGRCVGIKGKQRIASICQNLDVVRTKCLLEGKIASRFIVKFDIRQYTGQNGTTAFKFLRVLSLVNFLFKHCV